MMVGAAVRNTHLQNTHFPPTIGNVKAVLIGVSALLVLFGCSTNYGSTLHENFPAELKRIATADPKEDLKRAIKINDLRFVGVYGLSLDAPGVDAKHVGL